MCSYHKLSEMILSFGILVLSVPRSMFILNRMRVFITRVATGDSRGCVQIWDIVHRTLYFFISHPSGVMVQNHKAHEGDVLSLSVYHYIDQSGDQSHLSPSITTLIVSGGIDAKVGKRDDSNNSDHNAILLCFINLPPFIITSFAHTSMLMLQIAGRIPLPTVLTHMISSVLP